MGATFAAMPAPTETVSSAVVREEKWQDQLSAVGSVTAVQGVNVTTENAGTVREIAFESGTVVTNGQLLVRLDTSTEEAQLRAMESQSALSKTNLERSRQLRTANTISQSEFDTAESSVKQMEANADAIRAVIAKKTIRAPFAGQLGIRMVNLGEFLDVGKPIVSLQSLDAMHADFSLPQQEFGKLKKGMKIVLVTDAYADKKFEGELTTINPDIDVQTRSVGLQATFENKDHLLRPGMFARVEVILPKEEDVLVIPATSVLSAPGGDSVYVIEPASPSTNAPAANKNGLVVRQQLIKTGKVRGDFVTVETGLKAGEKVVSSGLFKLRNGMGVVENNSANPAATQKPKPADS
ncbi:MAG: efflux RND transporter periplasmic adaptor subunit [Verrucomicrobiota bacterium]